MHNKSLQLWVILGLGVITLGMVLAVPLAAAGPVQAPPAQATAAPTPAATLAPTPAATVAPTVTPTAAPVNTDYLYWIIGGAAVIVIAIAFVVWYTGRK